MKFQACYYKTAVGHKRFGIAKITSDGDVAWIVDGETGEKVSTENWQTFTLLRGPMAYIDTSYDW